MNSQVTSKSSESKLSNDIEIRKRIAMIMGVTVVLAAAAATFIGTHHVRSAKPASLPATTLFTDAKGLYKLMLPKSWQLQTDMATPPGVSEQVALAPIDALSAYKQIHHNDFLDFVTIQAITADIDPVVWFKAQNYGTPVASSTIPISGSTTYAAKVIGPAGMDDHYVVLHSGVIFHLIFHQVVTTAGAPKLDNTRYLQEFDKMATSLKFMR